MYVPIPEGSPCTAFEKFVEMRPAAAKFWLDDGISTNGYDLKSRDLAIVLDLGAIIDCGKTEKYREMTLHQKLLESNLANLLEHPLSEMFLVLKHQLLLKYAYLNLFFYLLFVISLTSLGMIGADMWACCGANNMDAELSNVGKDVSQQVDDSCTSCDDTDAKMNPSPTVTSVLDCAPPRPDCRTVGLEFQGLFWYLYSSTVFLSGLMCLRELTQAFSNWRRYVCDRENWLEITMLSLILGYLAALFSNPEISAHLAAVSVLLAWAELALLIGRFPNIGIYIYMSVHIMKKIVTILLSFAPIIFGFACAFRILIPRSDVFDNIIISILKVLVMMSGEFEFEANFRSESVREIGGSDITTQVVFVIFLFVVSIVISNLLIGLTVNETEIVFKCALDLRLERTFTQIVGVEDLLDSSIIKGLLNAFKSKTTTNLKDYLESARKDVECDQVSNKILVLPNQFKWDGRWWKDLLGLSTLFRGTNHPIYLYEEGKSIELEKLELPDSILQRIFTILHEREESKEAGPGAASATNTDISLSLNDKISNLETQVKHVDEKTGKRLETIKDQIKQSQEKVEEKLLRVERYLTRIEWFRSN